MTLVDDFFNAPTWGKIVVTLIERRSELQEQSCRDAWNRLVQHKTSTASRQLLSKYGELLRVIAAGDCPAFSAMYRSMPKLTWDELIELGQVNDADSARAFLRKFPDTAHSLVAQVLEDEPFWRLLFAGATKRSAAPQRTIGSGSKKTTIVIGERGNLYQICKILTLADGGFSLTMPYHNSRSGWLAKVRMPTRRAGIYPVSLSDELQFGASDRVKLSYHFDGFIQYSGEQQGKILSGRDPVTGLARGLGLMSKHLGTPIESGPSAGCLVWGLADFLPYRPLSKNCITFHRDEDFYLTGLECEKTGTEGYALHCYPFPAKLLESAIGPVQTGEEMTIKLPMHAFKRDDFLVKLVKVSEKVVLGIIAHRQLVGFSESGFQLNGAGDGEYLLFAQYPFEMLQINRNLDYRP